ncbi:hypothetical protein CBR_g5703 [Chara braunii]|uniref:Uncharacterized protein n=1 Tax=Chara braunii TaxID=69332 RepID=A0A388KJ60_CHABU|nr:hypothetical protein CBR_g5703 [Chara braunii]|eukprot:GBG70069.1 hypothetical protein CBR_g5703 [Chara braunii]
MVVDTSSSELLSPFERGRHGGHMSQPQSSGWVVDAVLPCGTQACLTRVNFSRCLSTSCWSHWHRGNNVWPRIIHWRPPSSSLSVGGSGAAGILVCPSSSSLSSSSSSSFLKGHGWDDLNPLAKLLCQYKSSHNRGRHQAPVRTDFQRLCIRSAGRPKVKTKMTTPKQKTPMQLKQDEARAAKRARRKAERLEIKASRPKPDFMTKLMEDWTNDDVIDFATMHLRLRKEDVDKLRIHRVTGKVLEFYTAEDIRRRLWIRPLAAKKLSKGIHLYPKPKQKLVLVVEVNEYGFAERLPVRVRSTDDVKLYLAERGALGLRRLAVGRDKRTIARYEFLRDKREYTLVFPKPRKDTGEAMQISAEQQAEEDAEMEEIFLDPSDELSSEDEHEASDDMYSGPDDKLDEEDEEEDDDDDEEGDEDEAEECQSMFHNEDSSEGASQKGVTAGHRGESYLVGRDTKEAGEGSQVRVSEDMRQASDGMLLQERVADNSGADVAGIGSTFRDPVPSYMKDRRRGRMDVELGEAVVQVFQERFPDLLLLPELSALPLRPRKITREERLREREKAEQRARALRRQTRFRLLRGREEPIQLRKIAKGEDAYMVWDVVAYAEDGGSDRLPGVMVVAYRKEIAVSQDVRDADWLARTMVMRARQENAGYWRDYVPFRGLAIVPVLAFETIPLLEEGTLSLGSQTIGVPIFVRVKDETGHTGEPKESDKAPEWRLWDRSIPVLKARPWVRGRHPKEKCLKVDLESGIPMLTRPIVDVRSPS